ncbi:MAG: hypothetical protein ABI629_02630 [bacterium]
MEGMRGIAMLMVLAFHTDGFVCWGCNPTGTWISPLVAFVRVGGGFGVDLLFVLSSFLLSLPFIQAVRAGRFPSYIGSLCAARCVFCRCTTSSCCSVRRTSRRLSASRQRDAAVAGRDQRLRRQAVASLDASRAAP